MVVTIRIFNKMFDGYDDLNASVQENVSAIRVVKAFVREGYEDKKFSKASTRLYKLAVKAESLLAFNNPAMMLSVYFCIIMVSWMGAELIVGGSLTTGDLTSLFSYIMSLLMSLMMLCMLVVMITMSLASVRRISEVLRETPDLHDPDEPRLRGPQRRHRLRPRQLLLQAPAAARTPSRTWTCTSSPARPSASSAAPARASRASSTSSAASTTWTSGDVKVGGIDVRDYDMEALRNQVAVVLQKNTLFTGTILENLRWGNADATLRECKAACRPPAPTSSSTASRTATTRA